MKRKRSSIAVFTLLIAAGLCATATRAQQTPTPAVPRLVQFSGLVNEAAGRPVAGVTFALYKDQEAGAPVWMETQNVPLDENGRYTVLLGSTKTGGLPMELFTSGEARWLGIQPEGQREQPRVLLLSVPYALKAGDAETIGGLPPSAFALATATTMSSAGTKPAALTAPATTLALSGSGTLDFIPLWTPDGNTLGNSILFQSTAGNVGINTKSPAARLDVGGGAFIRGAVVIPAVTAATSTKPQNSNPLTVMASAFNSNANAAVNQKYVWQAEPVGNNTATPSGTLNLLFGEGAGVPVETGVKVNSTGTVSGNGLTITGQPVNAIIGNAGCNGNFSAAIGFPITGPLNCTNYALLGDTGGNTFLNSSAAGDIIFLNSNNSLAVLDDLGNLTLQGVGNNPGSGNLAVDRGNVTVMNGNVNISGTGHGLTFPDGTTQTTAAAGTGGTGSFSGNNTTQIVNVTQQGTGKAVNATAAGTNAIGLWGNATSTSGANRGVVGGTGSGSGGIGVLGLATGTTLAPPGNGIGVSGASFYTQGIGVSGSGFVGVQGISSLASGIAVQGTSSNAKGIAGVFDNSAGGLILSGRVNGIDKFRVNGAGSFSTAGSVQATSAAFSGNGNITAIGDPGCNTGFAGIGFSVSGILSGCTNYALLGDKAGNTYINSNGSGAFIHFRTNNNEMATIDSFGGFSVQGNVYVPTGAVAIGQDTPMHSAPHMTWSTVIPGSDFASGNSAPFTENTWTPDRDVVITRMEITQTGTIIAGCIINPTPTKAVIELDAGGSEVSALSIFAERYVSGGPGSYSVTGGTKVSIIVAQEPSCPDGGFPPNTLNVTVQYVMN